MTQAERLPGFEWCSVCRDQIPDVLAMDHFRRHAAAEEPGQATTAIALWASFVSFGASMAFLFDKIIKTL